MAGQPGRSGGKRSGQPGGKYPNRSDMRRPQQAIQTTASKTYGDATAQAAAQKVIPLSRPAAPSSGSPSPTSSGAPTMAGGGAPPVIPSLTDPSTRPNEPITAGLPSGPGAGPEALQAVDPLVKAAAVLNQLGDRVDPHTAKIRAMVNAHLANQGAA